MRVKEDVKGREKHNFRKNFRERPQRENKKDSRESKRCVPIRNKTKKEICTTAKRRELMLKLGQATNTLCVHYSIKYSISARGASIVAQFKVLGPTRWLQGRRSPKVRFGT